MNLIKVFANSRVFAIAGAIMGVIRDRERAVVYAVGEEAIEQALKAVDLTIVYCKKDEIEIHCVMESGDATIDVDAPPAVRLIVEPEGSLDRSFELTQRVPVLN